MTERCQRCQLWWSHYGGPRTRFAIINRLCPICIPKVFPAVNL